MSTVQEVWGFSRYLAVDPEGAAPIGPRFLAAMNAGAADRGIAAHVPSDALDASRLIIMSEAAQQVGADFEIVDDTLRLAPTGVTVDWSEVERVAGGES